MDRCIYFEIFVLLLFSNGLLVSSNEDIEVKPTEPTTRQNAEIITASPEVIKANQDALFQFTESNADQRAKIIRASTHTHDSANGTSSGNGTYNESSVPSHRWPCKSFNITDIAKTVIVENETIFSDILAKMNVSHGCGLLLFYSPYCEFSATMAPLYNAIGRLYPDLAVMAVDTQEAMGTAARYGVVGIPSVFFFYSGRPVAKFNQSRTPANFEKFIKQMSGYYVLNTSLNVTSEDKEGPLNNHVTESRDYYMMFSVSFLSLYIGSRLFGNHLLSLIFSIVEFFKRKLNEWTTPRDQEKEKED